MPVSSETLRLLVKAGLDGDEIVEVVASIERDQDNSPNNKRSSESAGARRMREYRQRRVDLGMPAYFDGKSYRPSLIERDGPNCIYCGCDDASAIDHMVPIAQGGCDHLDNLALACNACNGKKSGNTPEQAGMDIISPSAQEAHVRYERSPERRQTSRARVEDKPLTQNKTKEDKKPSVTPRKILESVLDPERAKAVVEHRQRIRKAMTAHAASLLLAQLKACPDAAVAADMMIERGWASIKPEWIANQSNGRGNTGPPDRQSRMQAAIAETRGDFNLEQ